MLDPDTEKYGRPEINKELVAIGEAIRDVRVRNADNIYHRKLMRYEDKMYEIDQEIHVLDFLKLRIARYGMEETVEKINYSDSLKQYLATCKTESEFVDYLGRRREELEREREDVVLAVKSKAPMLIKKTYDQRTQNGLYYDAYDFNISSLDCLYDYLQRETFEYQKEFDWVYDISSVNHLRLRNTDKIRSEEKKIKKVNSRKSSHVEIDASCTKHIKTEAIQTEDMLSVYSIENSISEEKVAETGKTKKKIIIKHRKASSKHQTLGRHKLIYGDLNNLKKLISLDFSNNKILELTLELLIQRSDAFYLSKARVI